MAWLRRLTALVVMGLAIVLSGSTAGVGKATPTPGATATVGGKLTPTATPIFSTATPLPATATPTGPVSPYPTAPECATHDLSTYHGLWDAQRGCHYDHEHGADPFTNAVAAAFPGYDLLSLLGGVQIGSTNPSSPIENTTKHGGFKWQVDLPAPQGCVGGFEDAQWGVSAAVIEFHSFGDAAHELEARLHSVVALVQACDPANPADVGTFYTVQLADYGQRISPYQGDLLPYPNQPAPAYNTAQGPYVSLDCVGTKSPGQLGACRSSLSQIRADNLNTNSTWTSKGNGTPGSGSTLVRLLFRVRDDYQVVDWDQLTYPVPFLFICSNDGGVSYAPAGCRWNNSTATVDEVAGVVPAEWDNLAGWDSDPRVGRVTAQGFLTRYGVRNPACMAPSTADDCFPFKAQAMFVGRYGAELSAAKVSNPTPDDTPERDVYFCGGVVCRETDAGAVPSGWIGVSN